ncbi:HAMP domain-containing sensor histidine kinase [Sporofaciens musculi]|jgi:signal transduction histidine kinase|uniref:HAMP domain-containing sensor histidine kinase n=1 Tax=Sporofaciens musculi TaxID=2681861 RepID=UPI002570B783|nr:HAMP domain-containing sensor histidine kinase [Sporofaciens musculi]
MKQHAGVRIKITLLTTGFVFILLVLTMFASNILIIFAIKHGWFKAKPGPQLKPFLFQSGIISIIIGTTISFFMSHFPLRPLNTLIRAIHEVSAGNYDVKIHLEHPKEFLELSECFNQMTEELAGTEMFRSDFINNFSHEFKTPIVSILGFAKLLRSQKLDACQSQEYLDIIIEESRRLSELSSTVLNLSKVESLTLLTNKTVYSLSEQLREAILLLENKWSKKQIDFDIDMEEVMIKANAPLLKQVWMNLLDNAVKFSPAGGCIAVTLRSNNGDAVFTVKDQGPGMDDNIKKYIFDKFYQGDKSHHMEGNGLGLPLVKRILELHKGEITVQSQTGKGSVFTVTIPSG